MKLVPMVVLLAPFVASSAFAADVGFAIKAGAQRSWADVSGPAAFETAARSRFAAGVAVPIWLHDRVSLDPELLYTEVRFGLDGFDPAPTITSRSFQVALPFRRHWNTNGSVSPHLGLGPALTLIGATRQESGGVARDISDDVRDVDLELLLAGGVGIGAGRGRGTLELRYALGLRNLDSTGNDIKVRGLQLLLGYRF